MATSTLIAWIAILGPPVGAFVGAALRAYFGPGSSLSTSALNSLEKVPGSTLDAVVAAHKHGQLLQGHAILRGLSHIAAAALGLERSVAIPATLPGGVPLPTSPNPAVKES